MGTGELDQLRWKLAEALRSGLPLASPRLVDHLRLAVAGQLAMNQPHYSALAGP